MRIAATRSSRGDLLLLEDQLDELVVVVRDLLEQVLARGVGLVGHVRGDVLDQDLLAEVVVVDDGLHVDEVDDAEEVALGADRQLQRHGVRAEAVDHRLDALGEVRADAVHLVDVGDARDLVLVGLAPDGLRLRLDAGDGVEQRDRAVEHAQRALDLDGEVHVAGRVDDVDAVVGPLAGRRGGRDRDAALLLLLHPVHRGRALVDLAHLVGAAGVVEDALGRRGLARVDVGHDPDVPGLLERELARHEEVVFSLFRAEKTGLAGPHELPERTEPETRVYVSRCLHRKRAHAWAAAPAATHDYSIGPMATSAPETAVPGRVPRLVTRYWLLVPLLAGAALLIVAEFLPLYEIRTITAVPEGGRTSTGAAPRLRAADRRARDAADGRRSRPRRLAAGGVRAARAVG